MEASQNVAFYFYQKDKHVNTYRSRMIRAWGDEYLKSKSLPVFMQGVHSKVRPVITDEDVQHKFKSFLRSMKDFDRTPGNFCAAYNNDDDRQYLARDCRYVLRLLVDGWRSWALKTEG